MRLKRCFAVLMAVIIVFAAGCSTAEQHTQPAFDIKPQTEFFPQEPSHEDSGQDQVPKTEKPGLEGQGDVPDEEEEAADVPAAPELVPVESVSLSPNALNLQVGETAVLQANITPGNATSRGVTWSSSNSAVASVCQSGIVTAHSAGNALVTVQTLEGGKTAAVRISVTPPVVPVTGISVNPGALSLTVGQTTQLSAAIFPVTASNKLVTWSSSNSAVAAVSNTGVVSAQGAGSAEIAARSGVHTATISVKVSAPAVSVTGISVNPSSLNLAVNQSAQTTATIDPANATDKGVTWASSNTSVATVSTTGVITAQGAGTAVVTVRTMDGGRTATVTVTVPEPAGETGTAQELQMLNLINQERQREGLAPLRFNLELTNVARVKSEEMRDLNYFSHDSPVYGSPFEMMRHFGIRFTAAGENLALYPSVEGAHQGLMNSPGHRANILHTSFTEIGIGIIRDSRGQYFITQMFIRP